MFRNLVLLLTFFAGSSAFVVAPSARLSTSLAVAVDTSEIKNGMTIEIDGEPHKVLSFSIMKQARGAAKTTIKFKNLERGNTIENTYRSGEKFETAMIERVDAQFTFQEGVRNSDASARSHLVEQKLSDFYRADCRYLCALLIHRILSSS
jgi:hypothetical protein